MAAGGSLLPVGCVVFFSSQIICLYFPWKLAEYVCAFPQLDSKGIDFTTEDGATKQLEAWVLKGVFSGRAVHGHFLFFLPPDFASTPPTTAFSHVKDILGTVQKAVVGGRRAGRLVLLRGCPLHLGFTGNVTDGKGRVGFLVSKAP